MCLICPKTGATVCSRNLVTEPVGCKKTGALTALFLHVSATLFMPSGFVVSPRQTSTPIRGRLSIRTHLFSALVSDVKRTW